MSLGVPRTVVAVLLVSVLAGCSSSHSSEQRAEPGEPTSSSTSPSAPVATVAEVRFDQPDGPGSGHACVPSSERGPVRYVYYPTSVRSDQPIRLVSVALERPRGVVRGAAIVAPTGHVHESGLIRGGLDAPFLVRHTNTLWGDREALPGARLQPDRWYVVFVVLTTRAGADRGRVLGYRLSYRDAGQVEHATFHDRLLVRRSC